MLLNMYAGVPQNLPAWDNQVVTGEMGDCVSVIVLWNLAGTQYTNVRGWHGMGGIEAINFQNLLHGVPNHITTQIIVIASSMGTLGYLLMNVQTRIFALRPAANIRIVKNLSNARVNRQGFVTRA